MDINREDAKVITQKIGAKKATVLCYVSLMKQESIFWENSEKERP